MFTAPEGPGQNDQHLAGLLRAGAASQGGQGDDHPWRRQGLDRPAAQHRRRGWRCQAGEQG